MKTQDFKDEIAIFFSEAYTLMEKKNADYADDGDPFKNFKMSRKVRVDPGKAILVRMSDKLSRAGNLLDRPAQVKGEAIKDTLIDIANYSAILNTYLISKHNKHNEKQSK